MTSEKNTQQNIIEEDEIDLRELFATIWSYKKSIISMTLLITIIAGIIIYKMPKYYKTTMTIEVKPKAGDSQGLSLGGAGALLGLAGISAGSSSVDKDAELMKTYRINGKVLDKIDYKASFFVSEKFKEIELVDDNCSIEISSLNIPDYKDYGMKILMEPVSANNFKLYLPSRFTNKLLGKFEYGKSIKTKKFQLIINKKDNNGTMPSTIVLNSSDRYIYENIISKNLSIEVDKKSPFLDISYLDTIPSRGEAYLRALVDTYIDISLKDERYEDDITLASLNKQIKEVKERVGVSSTQVEKYKSKNQIISPSDQAGILVKSQAEVEELLKSNIYKEKLVKKLISTTKKAKNVDNITPSLIELGDKPSIELISKLQELQLTESSLAQEYKAAYPKLKSIRKQIKIVISTINSNLLNMQKVLSNRIKELKKQKKNYKEKLTAVPKKEKKLTSITINYKLDEKIYSYLLQKKSATELKKAEALSRFRTIEDIYTNPRAAKPKKVLMLIVTFITSIILMIFVSFFREFIRDPKEEQN